MWRWISGFLLSCSLVSALESTQVVVVYNEDSALSREAAQMYCKTRRIATSRMVALGSLPNAADISRSDYERLMVQPLLFHARVSGWLYGSGAPRGGKTPIYALVLMPDLPLRVKGEDDAKRSPLQKTHASVDSELALIGLRFPPEGPLVNPYYNKDSSVEEAKPRMTIVSRLDAPDRECVLRMISDPPEVEKRGLWGWTVVDQGGPYAQGDKRFASVAKRATDAYMPLYYDQEPQRLAAAYPLMEQTACYFGWYTELADGPFAPGAAGGFRFAPGAIAHHLHSFSATSIRDSKRWVGALLKRGASVTAGNVAEPYLDGTLDLAVFYDRLLKGYTVGEAAMMATPCLSWQGVVLGDPLYRPFAQLRQAETSDLSSRDPFQLWQKLCRMASGSPQKLKDLIPKHAPASQAALMAEMYGGLCSALKNPKLAATFYAFAAKQYAEERDRLRCMHLQAVALTAAGEKKAALELMDLCEVRAQGTPYEGAMRQVAQRMREKLLPKPEQPQKPGA